MTQSESIQADVTADLLKGLADGNGLPWRTVYTGSGGLPRSMSSGKVYQGINPLLLLLAGSDKGYSSAWWGTFNQIKDQGGQIRKGEKSTRITFYGTAVSKVPDPTTGKRKGFRFLKTFRVFNLEQADWAEGVPAKFAPVIRTEVEANEEAERIVTAYLADGGPKLISGAQNIAWYDPRNDLVNVPQAENLRQGTYYSVLFHELGHSTGHPTRLNREGIINVQHERGTIYAFEELVAEFTAAILSATVGITDNLDNSAAYMRGWASYLRSDPSAAIKAASAAQKAVNLILGVEAPGAAEAASEAAEPVLASA